MLGLCTKATRPVWLQPFASYLRSGCQTIAALDSAMHHNMSGFYPDTERAKRSRSLSRSSRPKDKNNLNAREKTVPPGGSLGANKHISLIANCLAESAYCVRKVACRGHPGPDSQPCLNGPLLQASCHEPLQLRLQPTRSAVPQPKS